MYIKRWQAAISLSIDYADTHIYMCRLELS